MTDDRMETIHDRAEIRATDEPDGRGDFPCCTTPAPVGAAVALDLGALHETICDNFTGMAEVRQAADLLVAEVRRLTGSLEEVDQRMAEPITRPGQAEDAIRMARLHIEAALAGRSRPLALAAARAESAEAEVRRLTRLGQCDLDLLMRAEAAEAEVATLRARLARARRCGCGWCCSNNADGVIPGDAHLICSRYAALATTGEGQ